MFCTLSLDCKVAKICSSNGSNCTRCAETYSETNCALATESSPAPTTAVDGFT